MNDGPHWTPGEAHRVPTAREAIEPRSRWVRRHSCPVLPRPRAHEVTASVPRQRTAG